MPPVTSNPDLLQQENSCAKNMNYVIQLLYCLRPRNIIWHCDGHRYFWIGLRFFQMFVMLTNTRVCVCVCVCVCERERERERERESTSYCMLFQIISCNCNKSFYHTDDMLDVVETCFE